MEPMLWKGSGILAHTNIVETGLSIFQVPSPDAASPSIRVSRRSR